MSGDRLRRFEVAQLLDPSGKRQELSGEYEFERLASSAAETTGVGYELVVEAAGSQIVVEGTVRPRWSGACRRCLEPVQGESQIAIREIFEDSPTEGETYPIHDTHIDLGTMIEEAVLLGLPLVPLCGSECAGPAPDRFPTGSEPEAVEGPAGDPRWAALDDFTFE